MSNVTGEDIEKEFLCKTLHCYPDDVLLQVYSSNNNVMAEGVLNYAFKKSVIQNREVVSNLKYIHFPEFRNYRDISDFFCGIQINTFYKLYTENDSDTKQNDSDKVISYSIMVSECGFQ